MTRDKSSTILPLLALAAIVPPPQSEGGRVLNPPSKTKALKKAIRVKKAAKQARKKNRR